MKLQASSLMYALMITLLIALLSSMFISMVHLSHIRVDMLSIRERLVRNCESGMEIALHHSDGPEEEVLDLFQEGIDSIKIERKYWGAYRLLKVRSFFRREGLEQIVLAGKQLDTDLVLYLADKNRALNLCGNTQIHGNAYLPPSGIKRAYIEGKTFTGGELLYGEKHLSEKYLPGVTPGLLEALYRDDLLEGKNFLDVSNENELLVERSFAKPTEVLYEGDVLQLDGHYSGNILIVADSLVEINAGARLEDVLVYAPIIKVQDGFSGSVQLFASDSLLLGKSCFLKYPSVAACYNSEKEAFVGLMENTKVEGMIFCKGKLKKRSFATHVFMDKDTELLGELYVEGGNLELRSSQVIGSTYCDRFVLHTRSSVYENHLIDVKLNRGDLPTHYAASALSLTNGEKTIVKCLP